MKQFIFSWIVINRADKIQKRLTIERECGCYKSDTGTELHCARIYKEHAYICPVDESVIMPVFCDLLSHHVNRMVAAARYWRAQRDVWSVLVSIWADTIDLQQDAARVWPISS